MRMIKNYILLLLMLVITIISGCNVTKKEIKVDLIVKTTESEFWQSLYKGAKVAADKYGIKLTFSGPKEEAKYREQRKIFEKRLKTNPQAIILAAGDYYSMGDLVGSTDIPVILVDSLIQGDDYASFISTDNYNVGVTLAREVIKRYGSRGNLGIISYVKNTSTAIDREKGFVDTIKAESHIKLIDTLFCEADIEKAKRQTKELIDKNDVDIIVGLNAQSTIGIARAIEELTDKSRQIFVAGVDCVVEQADYIEKDIIQVSILQNPYMMGYYSVVSAYNLLQGYEVEKNTFVDMYIIDKESLFDKESQELIFPFE